MKHEKNENSVLCDTTEDLKKIRKQLQQPVLASASKCCINMPSSWRRCHGPTKMDWSISILKQTHVYKVFCHAKIEAAFGSDSNFVPNHVQGFAQFLPRHHWSVTAQFLDGDLPRPRSAWCSCKTCHDRIEMPCFHRISCKTTITRPYIKCKTLTIRKRPLQHSIWQLWQIKKQKYYGKWFSAMSCASWNDQISFIARLSVNSDRRNISWLEATGDFCLPLDWLANGNVGQPVINTPDPVQANNPLTHDARETGNLLGQSHCNFQ